VQNNAGGISPLILALLQSETDSVDPSAVNKKTGATGVMQLMPDVYNECKIDPLNPYQNILCGITHLKKIQDTLHKVDPLRFPPAGVLPEGFGLRCVVAGWVWKWSLKAGIAKYVSEYKGSDWNELLDRYDIIPLHTRKWIEKVVLRTENWKEELKNYSPRVAQIGGKDDLFALVIIALLVLGLTISKE